MRGGGKRGEVVNTSLLFQLAVLLPSVLYIRAKIIRAGDDFIADFKLIEGNRRIKSNCIGNFTHATLRKCVYLCISNESCQTFNHHEGLQICEILNISKFDQVGLIEHSRGWNHYETDCNERKMGTVCEKVGKCKEYETCEDTFDYTLYKCRCPDGFNGTKCKHYLDRGSSESNPAPACSLIISKYTTLPDGFYWIKYKDEGKAVKKYCRRKGTKEALFWTQWSYCNHDGVHTRKRQCHDPRAKDSTKRNCENEVQNRACTHIAASSCKEIKESNPSTMSGLFTLSSKTDEPIKVYCDMDTGKGGWMLIGNLTNEKDLKTNEATKLTTSSRSTNIKELYKVKSEPFLFDATYLSDLNTDFNQLRFYCHKNGITIHIYTLSSSKDVFEFFTSKKSKKSDRPLACGTYKRYGNDNSTLNRNCKKWRGRRWGWDNSNANDIYSFPMYIFGKRHFSLYKNRLLCDDMQRSRNKGAWKVYVR